MSGINFNQTSLIKLAIICLVWMLALGGFLYYNQNVDHLIDDTYLWGGLGCLITVTLMALIIGLTRLKSSAEPIPIDSQNHLVEQASIVLDSIGEGVAAINKDKNVTFINPEAKAIVGWGDSDVVDIAYVSIFDFVNANGEAIDEENDPIRLCFVHGKRVNSRNFFLKTIGGKIIPISILVNPLQDGSESVIITFRNISLELEEEREQREFISTASHEMRTPVAAIEGYLGLALNPKIAQVDAKAREYIEKAQESSKHLGELFRNLLNISKAEDGRMMPKLEVINLVDFIENITQEFQQSAKSKGISLIFAPRDTDAGAKITPVINVESDKSLLREVASNLIENGIKYTPQGSVTIDVTIDEKDSAFLKVTDTGIGIPIEDQPHLFQKFYRVDNSQTREIGGTGLGLYLTRRIVENLHGRIWVDSKFGEGCTFIVSLPRLSNHQAEILLKSKNVSPDQVKIGDSTQDPTTEPYNRPQFQVPEGYAPTPMSNYTVPVEKPKIVEPTPMSNYKPDSERKIDPALQDRLRAMGYTPSVPSQQLNSPPTQPVTDNVANTSVAGKT